MGRRLSCRHIRNSLWGGGFPAAVSAKKHRKDNYVHL